MLSLRRPYWCPVNLVSKLRQRVEFFCAGTARDHNKRAEQARCLQRACCRAVVQLDRRLKRFYDTNNGRLDAARVAAASAGLTTDMLSSCAQPLATAICQDPRAVSRAAECADADVTSCPQLSLRAFNLGLGIWNGICSCGVVTVICPTTRPLLPTFMHDGPFHKSRRKTMRRVCVLPI